MFEKVLQMLTTALLLKSYTYTPRKQPDKYCQDTKKIIQVRGQQVCGLLFGCVPTDDRVMEKGLSTDHMTYSKPKLKFVASLNPSCLQATSASVQENWLPQIVPHLPSM